MRKVHFWCPIDSYESVHVGAWTASSRLLMLAYRTEAVRETMCDLEENV